MPRFLYSQAKIRGSNFFANLDSGVGAGRSNKKEDVILVQFFLEALRKRWGGAREVARDGIAGRITIDSILAFQTYIGTKYNVPVKRDSAVDPTLRPAHSIISTLGWMHDEYIATFPQHWPSLFTHPVWTGTNTVGLFW